MQPLPRLSRDLPSGGGPQAEPSSPGSANSPSADADPRPHIKALAAIVEKTELTYDMAAALFIDWSDHVNALLVEVQETFDAAYLWHAAPAMIQLHLTHMIYK